MEHKVDNSFLDNLSDDEAWALLFLLLYNAAEAQTWDMWNKFEREIKFKSRYFPKGELLEQIEKLKNIAETTIHEGEKYWRARLFESTFFDENKKEGEQIKDLVIKSNPDISGMDIQSIFKYVKNIMSEGLFSEDLFQILSKKKRFWGYNSKDSDAPPSKFATEGRVNPRNISYLYLANDEKTAIYEVRPNIDQDISVATIRINRDLKIYDFCNNNIKDDGDWFALIMLSRLFSRVKNGEEDYFATQYICEYIRELGFDGVRFKSSLNKDGQNTVLFDTQEDSLKKKNYTILNSKVFSVTEYNIKYKQVVPMKKRKYEY